MALRRSHPEPGAAFVAVVVPGHGITKADTKCAEFVCVKRARTSPAAAPSTSSTLTHVRAGSAETDESGTVAKPERAAPRHTLTAQCPLTSACRSAAARKALHQRRNHVCAASAERRIRSASGDAGAQTLLAEHGIALPPVASGCASTAALGVYMCSSQVCIAAPRHLCALQPAAAAQVAGATQTVTRRPGREFCSRVNPKRI